MFYSYHNLCECCSSYAQLHYDVATGRFLCIQCLVVQSIEQGATEEIGKPREENCNDGLE